MSKRAGMWFSVAIGAVPLWFVCDFYLFWLLSYLHLGAWPRQYLADPQSLPFGYYYERLFLCIVLWPFLLGGAAAGLVCFKLTGGRFWPGFLALVVSSGIFLSLWNIDPGDCVEWFFD